MSKPNQPLLRSSRCRPILITGGRGTLGQAFARICRERGLAFQLLTRRELDIADDCSVDAALSTHSAWAVVNAAGYVRVDAAEQEPDRCYRENVDGPRCLARACARRGVRLLTFSSDLVFDGTSQRPYEESDPVGPLNVYGKSKADAEWQVLEAMPASLVVRTSAFFGPWDEHNFVTLALRALERREPFHVLDDGTVTPTYVPDLVHTSLDLLIDGESGLWHLSNGDPISWSALAARVADMAQFDAGCINLNEAAGNSMAKRPAYSALGSARGTLMPSLDSALDRYWHGVAAAGKSRALLSV